MDISEIDLLRKFIEEKNLLSQYQEWRKFYSDGWADDQLIEVNIDIRDN